MKKSLFLFVAGVASSALAHGFGEKVVAFYPFRDGAAGTSAVGKTLTNLIDKADFPGRVEQTGEGDILFSDEHPAQYVFNDLTWNAPIAYENPGSLYFPNSGNKANHAKLFFDGVVKYLNDLVEASGNNNDAWKIEFFFKCDTDQYIGTSTDKEGQTPDFLQLSRICDAAGQNTDALTHTNCDYIVRFNDNGAMYRLNGRTTGYKVSDGTRATACSGTWMVSDTKDKTKDGKWHYISVSSGYNNFAFCGRPNYHSEGNNFRLNRFPKSYHDSGRTVFRVLDPDDVAPMIFNPNGTFRGWISCLKITRNEGITSANMHCSEVATCVPRTVTHVRFEEGADGAAMANGSYLENVAALSTVNTNISYFKFGRGSDGTAYYGVPQVFVSTETGASASFTNDVKRRFVCEKGEEEAKVANARSGRFTAPDPVTTGDIAQGVGFTYPTGNFMKKDSYSEFTFECFARFDFNDWTNRIATATETEKNVALFWTSWSAAEIWGSYAYGFSMRLNIANPSKPVLYAGSYATGSSCVLPAIADGKWHHYALTLKPYGKANKCDYRAYFDYKKVLSQDGIAHFSWHTNGSCYDVTRYIHCFRSNQRPAGAGRDGGLHCFDGEVDELRISNGLLEPADFLRQRSFEGASFIVK